jgi:carbamoyltransferase
MLYQYTTAYLGMKMHNHEYKMLGYEAHITEVLSASHIVCLNDIIANDAEKRLKSMFNEPIDKDMDPLVNKDALAAAQHEITNLLDGVLEQLELKDPSVFAKRVVIAYYVQNIVEAVIGSLVNLYKPQNLMVAGGLFYNVKLNHKLADMVDMFSVFPLAGDQGAGLGVYEANHRDLIWPGHLNWGHRDLSLVNGVGIVNVSNSFDAMGIMADELSKNGMVNIVRGAMEFGPRSLCNTATIAKPTMGMVETINV